MSVEIHNKTLLAKRHVCDQHHLFLYTSTASTKQLAHPDTQHVRENLRSRNSHSSWTDKRENRPNRNTLKQIQIEKRKTTGKKRHKYLFTLLLNRYGRRTILSIYDGVSRAESSRDLNQCKYIAGTREYWLPPHETNLTISSVLMCLCAMNIVCRICHQWIASCCVRVVCKCTANLCIFSWRNGTLNAVHRNTRTFHTLRMRCGDLARNSPISWYFSVYIFGILFAVSLASNRHQDSTIGTHCKLQLTTLVTVFLAAANVNTVQFQWSRPNTRNLLLLPLSFDSTHAIRQFRSLFEKLL